MTDEARELHRIISSSVRDMLDAYRIQAQAGPVRERALEGLVFRAAHPVVNVLARTLVNSGSPCCRAWCA